MSKRELKNLKSRVTFAEASVVCDSATIPRENPGRRCKRRSTSLVNDTQEVLQPIIRLSRIDRDLPTQSYKPGKRNQRSASAIQLNLDTQSSTNEIKNLIATNCKLTNEILKTNNSLKLSEAKYIQLMEKSYADISTWNDKIIESEQKYIEILREGFQYQKQITGLELAVKSKDDTILQLRSKVRKLEVNSMDCMQHGNIY